MFKNNLSTKEDRNKFKSTKHTTSNIFRINPNLPKHCQALINHAYTDYKIPTYKCNGEFYSKLEWSLSAKLQSIDYVTFSKLNLNQSYKIFNQYKYSDCYSNCNDPYNQYFKKIPFTKKCWSY